MSGHSLAINTTPEPELPNQPFFAWLKSETTLYVSQVLGIIGFVSGIAALLYYILSSYQHLQDEFELTMVIKIIYYLHIPFLTVFIFELINILDKNDEESDKVMLVFDRIFNRFKKDSDIRLQMTEPGINEKKRILTGFKTYFLFFWVATLFLYFVLAFSSGAAEGAGAMDEDVNALISILTFTFNNIASLFIFLCFTVLYWVGNPQKESNKAILQGAAVLVTFLLTGGFVLGILHFSGDPGKIKDITTICFTISGTLNALVLCMLIARLDSKLIGLPSWLISVLYFYAAIQPLFVAFDQTGTFFLFVKTLVVIVVFIFKIYFFYIILYTLRTGRMLNYMLCFVELSNRVEKLSITGFGDWLKKKLWTRAGAEYMISIVVLCLAACAVVFFLKPPGGNEPFLPGPFERMAEVLHLPLVAVFIFLIWKKGESSEFKADRKTMHKNIFGKDESEAFPEDATVTASLDENNRNGELSEPEKRLRDFRHYFIGYWISILLLYLTMIVAKYHEYQYPPDDKITLTQSFLGLIEPFLGFVLNNAGMICLFGCIMALTFPVVDEHTRRKLRVINSYTWVVFGLIIFSFGLCYPVFSSLFFTDSLRGQDIIDFSLLYDAFTGILSAVVLALLIARLDSKLIGLSASIIGILYLYAAIQPLYILFYQHESIFLAMRAVLIFLSLGLKVYLFLVIFYAMQSGRILNYLYCFPTLNKLCDSIFDNQFEIKIIEYEEDHHKRFKFIIYEHHKPVFFTDDKGFESRHDCLSHIKDLIEEIRKTPTPFVLEEENHFESYIVKIKYPNVLEKMQKSYFSKEIKTKLELEEFKEATLDKLPFSKITVI